MANASHARWSGKTGTIPASFSGAAGNETILEVASATMQRLIRRRETPRGWLPYAATGDQKPKNCDFIAFNTYDGWYTAATIPISLNRRIMTFVSETGIGRLDHAPHSLWHDKVDGR